MHWLIHVFIAMALIALMISLRMLSSQAIFRFRMNNGFRAHECDGTCHQHGKAAALESNETNEFE
jgi:hypothetical protein